MKWNGDGTYYDSGRRAYSKGDTIPDGVVEKKTLKEYVEKGLILDGKAEKANEKKELEKERLSLLDHAKDLGLSPHPKTGSDKLNSMIDDAKALIDLKDAALAIGIDPPDDVTFEELSKLVDKKRVMMNLILENESFLATSLEDPELFGWPVILENQLAQKQGHVEGSELYCQARHINLLIDMETGADVQQEQASVTVRLSSITIGVPEKNWKVEVTDTSGNIYKCYVTEAIPDRTFGIVVLKLGLLES